MGGLLTKRINAWIIFNPWARNFICFTCSCDFPEKKKQLASNFSNVLKTAN